MALEAQVVPQVLVGLHGVCRAVFREGIGGFEGGAVEGVFGAEGVGVVIDEILGLDFPLMAQLVGLLLEALLFHRVDQFEHDELVVEAPLVGLVILGVDFVRVNEEDAGGFHGALEIALGVEVMHHVRIHPGDLVHVVVKHDHVGVIVGAPDVFLGEILDRPAVVRRVGQLAAQIHVAAGVPLARAIDAVRIRPFVIGALESTPDEVLEVVFERVDLPLVRVGDVLGGDVGRLAQAGVVAGEDVDHAVEEDVGILDGARDPVFHVVGAVDAVPPLGGILDLLLVDDEGGALLDEGFQCFGNEELEVGFAPAVVDDRQHVLSTLVEGDFVDMMVGLWLAERSDRGCFGEFGADRFDVRHRVERDAGREVLGDGHARDNAHVEQSVLIDQVAQFSVAVGKLNAEGVGFALPGGEVERGVFLAPSAFGDAAAADERMDVGRCPAASAAAGEFEFGAGPGGQQHEWRSAGGAHPVDERAVAGDELVTEKAVFEDPARAAAPGANGRDAHRKIADADRSTARGTQLDGPVELVAVDRVGLGHAQGIVGAGVGVGDGGRLRRSPERLTRFEAGPVFGRAGLILDVESKRGRATARGHHRCAEGIVRIGECRDAVLAIVKSEITPLDAAGLPGKCHLRDRQQDRRSPHRPKLRNAICSCPHGSIANACRQPWAREKPSSMPI